MGYSGLETWAYSDNAAELRQIIEEAREKRKPLDKVFYGKVVKQRDNEWNTEGCVNLALLLEDGFITVKDLGKKNTQEVLYRLGELLENPDNDEYHDKAYLRMVHSVTSMIAKK
jgi:hypothetical protein